MSSRMATKNQAAPRRTATKNQVPLRERDLWTLHDLARVLNVGETTVRRALTVDPDHKDRATVHIHGVAIPVHRDELTQTWRVWRTYYEAAIQPPGGAH